MDLAKKLGYDRQLYIGKWKSHEVYWAYIEGMENTEYGFPRFVIDNERMATDEERDAIIEWEWENHINPLKNK